MRILGLTNLFPNPLQPNRAPFNRDKFELLAKQHSVRVIAPISWTDELKARLNGFGSLPPNRRSNCGDLLIEHPRYWYLPTIGRRYHGHFYYASVKRAFFRAVKEFRPEVVLATWAFPDGWAGVQLARQAGLPIVIYVHGSDVLQLNQCSAKRRRTAEALQAADAVITVSNDLRDRIEELCAIRDKVHVIYNGVDTKLFTPGGQCESRSRLHLLESERIVLFVGNLVPVKSIHTLLEASSLLVRDGITHRVAIIGSGPLREWLVQKASKLGLTPLVQFLGSLKRELLPDWYRAANVVVLPSLSEGVPNVLLEAMACGTPFVASNVGGIREIATWGRGTLVPPSSAHALAEAMRPLLLESSVAVPGQIRDQQVMASQLIEVLESVVSHPPVHVPPQPSPI